MSAVLLMHIICYDKFLTTEYVHTNSLAVLFWSYRHNHALGCPFS